MVLSLSLPQSEIKFAFVSTSPVVQLSRIPVLSVFLQPDTIIGLPTEIQGYLRSKFEQQSKTNNHEYFGTITDRHYKLDVLLTKSDTREINYKKGIKLEIIGDLQEDGNPGRNVRGFLLS